MTGDAKHIVNWADVPSRNVEVGPISARWTNLGEAVGTVETGVRRIEVDPGKRSTPVHTHSGEEELFYVVGGSGVSYQGGHVYAVRSGDLVVHLPKGEAHTLIAGEEGLDVLAFSDRRPPESAFLPRAGVAWLGSTWVATGRGPHPFAQEAAAGELELGEIEPRPGSMVNLDDIEAVTNGRGPFRHLSRDLGRAAGSQRVGLRHVELPAGMLSWPLHCHSCEEEVFVVLGGRGAFILGDAEHQVGPGDVVARPAGQGVAHAFRGGEQTFTYLAFGQRDPRNVTWYPTSKKLSFRGVGVIIRVESLDYWDGEA